jgi:hypothetical protein
MVETLGRYRIVRQLGRGGMGTVYLAEDETGRRVALKVINAEFAAEAAFRERFRQEVGAARRVRRFSTAAVVDADLDGDVLWVATEFIDGPDLSTAVTERGPLRGSDLDALAVGIATALASIHETGLIHRDLKPANVLLSSVGPRVIDFGIARPSERTTELTAAGAVVGSPGYLAPELLSGGRVTTASDVFSWGCLIAYAGTGRAPFAGASVAQVMYRVAHEEPDLDGLDEGLRALVGRALDKDPARRPTVPAILKALTGTTSPTVVDVPPTRVAPPVAPPVVPVGESPSKARRPVLYGIGGVVVAGVVVAGYLGLSGGGDGGPKPPPTKRTIVNHDPMNDGGSTDAFHPSPGDRIFGFTSYVQFGVTDFPGRTLSEVQVKLTSGAANDQAGIGCFRTGGIEYRFMLRNDGTALIDNDVTGGNSYAVVMKKVDYHRGGYNLLQATCLRGSAKTVIQFWVNHRFVGEYDDTAQTDAFTDGAFYYQLAGDAKADAAYKDLSVWEV